MVNENKQMCHELLFICIIFNAVIKLLFYFCASTTIKNELLVI